MKRYEIWWVKFDPAQGSEIGKTRPAVIVSLDVLNLRLETITVCPLTSSIHPQWRSRIQITCAGKPAEIAVDQIRTISKSRLVKRLGALKSGEVTALRRLITEMYGEG